MSVGSLEPKVDETLTPYVKDRWEDLDQHNRIIRLGRPRHNYKTRDCKVV